jgi:hypothetical protein
MLYSILLVRLKTPRQPALYVYRRWQNIRKLLISRICFRQFFEFQFEVVDPTTIQSDCAMHLLSALVKNKSYLIQFKTTLNEHLMDSCNTPLTEELWKIVVYDFASWRDLNNSSSLGFFLSINELPRTLQDDLDAVIYTLLKKKREFRYKLSMKLVYYVMKESESYDLLYAQIRQMNVRVISKRITTVKKLLESS